MYSRTVNISLFVTFFILGILLLAIPVRAEKPMWTPDDSWINVSGTVESVDADSFVLDYGKNTITVEMDDGDRDADAYKLLPGDKVTVSGMIDDDLYEKRTIEASSVYVDKLNTYFYASAVDEEELPADTFITLEVPVVIPSTTIQGTVTAVTGDEEFILDKGIQEITVEVDAMPYNPLDNEGYQMIEVGDVVSVTGQMDEDFLEGREFVAESIVTIRD